MTAAHDDGVVSRPVGNSSSLEALTREAGLLVRTFASETTYFDIEPLRWAVPPYLDRLDLPEQGFKLHIPATVANAIEIFIRVAPALLADEIGFKCVASLEQLRQLNAGFFGLTQVGKFITVYPVGTGATLELAQRLHTLTIGFSCPRVPSDYPVQVGSNVHYRYGAIRGALVSDSDGHDICLLRAPDRTLVDDERNPTIPVPRWVHDPFARLDDDASALLAGRFVIYEALRQRGKGGVYRAVDLKPMLANKDGVGAAGRRVIVKEGRRAGESDIDGVDACERLRWQAKLLRELQGTGFCPTLLDLVEDGEDVYLVMDDVGGLTLRDWLLSGETPSESEALALTLKVARIVDALHARDVIWCDLSPDNILLSGSTVYISDLEHACRSDSPSRTHPGTPGFYPEAEEIRDLPTVQRDIYALGALLHVLTVPDAYRDFCENGKSAREAWRRPAVPDSMSTARTIVVASVSPAQPARYESTGDLIENLTASLASARVPI
jgi:hypothetical protein